MANFIEAESLNAIEMLVHDAGISSPHTKLTDNCPSPDDHVSSDAKRYYCQRCLNHGLEFQRKGHKPQCKFVTCQCDLCMMVEKRRQINNQLQRRNPNVASSMSEGKRERKPKCARCSAHGVKQDLRGHKKALCPFIACNCNLCALVEDRRVLMAKQIRIRRDQQKQKKRQRGSPDIDTASMESFNDGMSQQTSPVASTFCRIDQLVIAAGSEDTVDNEPECLPKPMESVSPLTSRSFNDGFCAIDATTTLIKLQEIAFRQQLVNNFKHLMSSQPQPMFSMPFQSSTLHSPVALQPSFTFGTSNVFATVPVMPQSTLSVVPINNTVLLPEALLQYLTMANNVSLFSPVLTATSAPLIPDADSSTTILRQ